MKIRIGTRTSALALKQTEIVIDEIKKSYHILKKYLNHIYLGNLTAEEIEYCINGE